MSLRARLVLLASAVLAADVSAQRVTITPQVGLSLPAGGVLTIPVPTPGQVGFTSEPHDWTMQSGVALGAQMGVRLAGPLTLVTGLSASIAKRETTYGGPMRACSTCTSVITGALIGLGASREASGGFRVRGLVGVEMLHLGGEAHSEPIDGELTATDAELVSSLVPAPQVGFGVEWKRAAGAQWGVDLLYRRYTFEYRWTDPSWTPISGDPTVTAHSEVRLTISRRGYRASASLPPGS